MHRQQESGDLPFFRFPYSLGSVTGARSPRGAGAGRLGHSQRTRRVGNGRCAERQSELARGTWRHHQRGRGRPGGGRRASLAGLGALQQPSPLGFGGPRGREEPPSHSGTVAGSPSCFPDGDSVGGWGASHRLGAAEWSPAGERLDPLRPAALAVGRGPRQSEQAATGVRCDGAAGSRPDLLIDQTWGRQGRWWAAGPSPET